MYFYAYDSYDLTAALAQDNTRLLDADTKLPGFQVAYSVDWTGNQMLMQAGNIDIKPGMDAPNQIQYPNPPDDRTMLTSCTYHATNAHDSTCPVIFTSGTVKPMNVKKFYQYGWDIANH